MSARRLEQEERLELIDTLLARVMRSADSLTPFTDVLPCRTYIDGIFFELEPDDLTAVTLAIQAAGDRTYYLHSLESADTFELETAASSDYYAATRAIALLENALLSPAGSWVIYLSSLDGALVAGTRPFMEALRAHLPNERLGAEILATLDDAWAKTVIDHLAGHE